MILVAGSMIDNEQDTEKVYRLKHSFKMDAWKQYFSYKITPFIGKDVLEVGAGIGSTTKALYNSNVENWCCLEPNHALFNELQNSQKARLISDRCELFRGYLHDVPEDKTFDTILYIDVLEHIQNDKAELEEAKKRLRPGGKLIVLSPAFQWLFSKFDEAIGHYRRYNEESIQNLVNPDKFDSYVFFLDSLGVFASLINKIFLRRSNISFRNYTLFNKIIIPISRIIDPLINYRWGRSIIMVMTKKEVEV